MDFLQKAKHYANSVEQHHTALVISQGRPDECVTKEEIPLIAQNLLPVAFCFFRSDWLKIKNELEIVRLISGLNPATLQLLEQINEMELTTNPYTTKFLGVIA